MFQPKPPGASIFGGGNNNTTASSSAPSAFDGGTVSQSQTNASSVFGAFGGTTPQSQTNASSVFGAPKSQTNASSVFGGAAPQSQTTASSVFGGTAPQSQTNASSVFGANANTQSQTNASSVFGTNANQQNQSQPAGSSLFGGSTNTSQPLGGSLFGATNNTSNNTNSANPTSSLFGGNNQQNQQSSTNAMTQPNTSLAQSGFGGMSQTSMAQAPPQELARSRLASQGIDTRTNEKSTADQIRTILRKWDPNSQDTLLQGWVYNAININYAMYYHRNIDEDEQEWEDALAKRPANVEDKTGTGETKSFIPVVVRGFLALGKRAEVQAQTLNGLRTILHDMKNSLDAIIARHQQQITVRLESTRRQHVVLAQRCLHLSVKVQTLRNRGYALDGAEEGFRRKLMALERQVFDPAFNGREEEIWARMVALRGRSRWLEEEGKRLGDQAEQHSKQENAAIPEEVVQKTKKILNDYDMQLVHLGKDLDELKKEYSEWEQMQKLR